MSQNQLRYPIWRLLLLVNSCVLTVLSLVSAAGGSEPSFSLYKSTNQGASWFKVGQGLLPKARINALSLVENTVVAGTDKGIYTSRDEGENWQSPLIGIGTEARALCLTVQTGRVFVGTQKQGVLVSDDAGMTWKATNGGLTDLYIRSLLTVGTKLYAGTDSLGVFVSENGGTSWINQRAGLPDASQVFDLADVDGTLFAALYSKGLHRWDSDRKLWVKSGKVVPLEIVTVGTTLVVGHNPGGVFVSEDRGTTWLSGNPGLPVNAPTWTLAADDERVWLGTSGKLGSGPDDIGLFTSKDHGKSWIRTDAGLPSSSAAVSFMVAKPFILVGVSSKE